MGDLIDRDALGVGPANPEVFQNTAYADGWNALLRIINQAPAVDAAPVVHGRWIKINKYDMESRLYCSSCKQEYAYIDGICYLVSGSELPFYCPNCGAKMEREEEHNGKQT